VADLTPTAVLLTGDDRLIFGQVASKDEAITWDLRAYLAYGKNGGQFQGFTLDPTENYLILAEQVVPLSAEPAHWVMAGGTFSYGTDAAGVYGGSAAGGTKFLRITALGAALFTATSTYTRADDEGLRLAAYRSAAPAGASSDLFLCFQPGAGAAGDTQYQLAVVPGSPIRLQSRTVDASGIAGAWSDLAAANALGESSAYLDSVQQTLSVAALPMTDGSWAAGLPDSSALSGPPPNRLVVVIGNGDAILDVPCTSFPGDALVGVTGHGGQVSVRLARRRYGLRAGCAVPEQVRPRDFAVAPVGRVQGYQPYGSVVTPTITLTDRNKAAGSLAVDLTTLADTTGFSPRTVFLSTLDADFPAVQVPPSPNAPWGANVPVSGHMSAAWNQAEGILRASAHLNFVNNDQSLSPNSVPLAVRAGQLLIGYTGFEGSGFFRCGVQPVLTGYTGLASQEGMAWYYQQHQRYFDISLDDRLRKGDADQIACGYRLPDDGQNHFYAQRTLAHTIGFTDDWLRFPLRERDDAHPGEYFLPRGTTLDPVMLAEPPTPVLTQMGRVRRVSGVYDPGSGQILPMALGTDVLGGLEYFGLPVGVVNAFSGDTSALLPVMIFGGAPQLWPDGAPILNEILDGGLRTTATLANIRTDIVFEGLDVNTGGAVVGAAKNELLAGPYSDSSVPGYVGTPVPLYDIDRLYASPEVAYVAAQLAATNLQAPAIGAWLKVYLQPWLSPLDVIAVDDFATTGSTSPVLFYITEIRHVVDWASDPERPEGYSLISARLLGQV